MSLVMKPLLPAPPPAYGSESEPAFRPAVVELARASTPSFGPPVTDHAIDKVVDAIAEQADPMAETLSDMLASAEPSVAAAVRDFVASQPVAEIADAPGAPTQDPVIAIITESAEAVYVNERRDTVEATPLTIERAVDTTQSVVVSVEDAPSARAAVSESAAHAESATAAAAATATATAADSATATDSAAAAAAATAADSATATDSAAAADSAAAPDSATATDSATAADSAAAATATATDSAAAADSATGTGSGAVAGPVAIAAAAAGSVPVAATAAAGFVPVAATAAGSVPVAAGSDPVAGPHAVADSARVTVTDEQRRDDDGDHDGNRDHNDTTRRTAPGRDDRIAAERGVAPIRVPTPSTAFIPLHALGSRKIVIGSISIAAVCLCVAVGAIIYAHSAVADAEQVRAHANAAAKPVESANTTTATKANAAIAAPEHAAGGEAPVVAPISAPAAIANAPAAPASCSISVRASSGGATIWLDGTARGLAPQTIAMPCQHTARVEVRHPRYAVFTNEVLINGDVEIDAKLEREKTELTVWSEPAGATVTYEGRVIGQTPLTTRINRFEIGRVELSAPGYDADWRQIVPKQATKTVSVTLKRH